MVHQLTQGLDNSRSSNPAVISDYCSKKTPGMNTKPWHKHIVSDSREVRLSKQLEDQAEKSPQFHKLSFWRDDGKAIPPGQ